jgi:hypothetical protein
MQLIEVNDKHTEKEFIRLPYSIYAHDPAWIAPLEKDIKTIFDKEKNPVLQYSDLIRWILKDNQGKVIGRVAAFVNHRALETMEYPAGGMGFFECIDDEKTAFLLFDACSKWLAAKGMKAMDGPVNLGERDRFWGLLVEGFDPPSYMQAYHPPYYRKFFENYGFRLYFEQHSYMIRRGVFQPERLDKIARYVLRKPEHQVRQLKMKELDRFVDDFVQIYNNAWEKFENFKPVTAAEVKSTFRSMAPVIEERFIWFAYVNEEPAGFSVMLPDVNQLFRYVHGKLDLIGKLKFLFYKYTRPINTLKGLVFGILPKYQNLGLDAAMADSFYKEMVKTEQYRKVGISWIGGFNPKMQSLMQALQGEVAKVHYTYRKLFDESIEFKPYAIGQADDRKE